MTLPVFEPEDTEEPRRPRRRRAAAGRRPEKSESVQALSPSELER